MGGFGTDDLLGNKTNTTWASCTVYALFPQLYISPQAVCLFISLPPHLSLSLSVTLYVCLSLTHSTNHHRVPETEGDCGFVNAETELNRTFLSAKH